MKNKKKKKENKIGTFAIIIIVLICIAIGIFFIASDFKKMNRAAGYSEKILNLYLNTKDK